MQTTKKDNLPKRMRYYQGMIDLNILEKGESYKALKKSFVIFICTFDLFGQGRVNGTIETLKSIGYSDEKIIEYIITQFGMSKKEACEYLPKNRK